MADHEVSAKFKTVAADYYRHKLRSMAYEEPCLDEKPSVEQG